MSGMNGSRGPAAATRAAAGPGRSVYCACHAKGSRGPSGGHARRRSSRTLRVLRLPRERQPRPQRRPRAPQLLQDALCTAPCRSLCVLHLPSEHGALRLPRESSRGPSGGHARCSSSRSLSIFAYHAKGSRGPSGGHAPQLLHDALCTGPATRKAAAAPAAAMRAAAPPGRSVYCACHPKGSRS